MTTIEYRPDGRQKVTQPNQPKPLSHGEADSLEKRRASDRARQAKHRAKKAKP